MKVLPSFCLFLFFLSYKREELTNTMSNEHFSALGGVL